MLFLVVMFNVPLDLPLMLLTAWSTRCSNFKKMSHLVRPSGEIAPLGPEHQWVHNNHNNEYNE